MAGVKKSGRKGGSAKTTGTARPRVATGATKARAATGTTKPLGKARVTKGTTGGTKGTKDNGKGSKGAKDGGKAATTARSKSARSKPAVVTAAPRRTILRIKELDPYRKCGPGTSVERLIRVDEEVAGRKQAHLVYLDRHGWYCEHGRTCHAVKHARKGVPA